MYRFFLAEPFAPLLRITGSDAHHISHVLRMKKGEALQIVSLDQVAAVMKITAFGEGWVDVALDHELTEAHEPTVRITLIQGLPKQDKMEWVIQKAVELGVTEILPAMMEHSVVRIDAAKAARKTERWQKIAEAAAKQSKRDIIPRIALPEPLPAILRVCDADLKLLPYEAEGSRGLREALRASGDVRSAAFVIGPEGGISQAEYALAAELGFLPVSLGPRILRTETAALAALSAILYETGNLGG